MRHSIRHDTKDKDSDANGSKAHVGIERVPEDFGLQFSWEERV